jgi:hypothetical protein
MQWDVDLSDPKDVVRRIIEIEQELLTFSNTEKDMAFNHIDYRVLAELEEERAKLVDIQLKDTFYQEAPVFCLRCKKKARRNGVWQDETCNSDSPSQHYAVCPDCRRRDLDYDEPIPEPKKDKTSETEIAISKFVEAVCRLENTDPTLLKLFVKTKGIDRLLA